MGMDGMTMSNKVIQVLIQPRVISRLYHMCHCPRLPVLYIFTDLYE